MAALRSKESRLVLSALVFVQSNFAVGSIVATLALPAMNPLVFALVRESIAGPVLTVVAIRWHGKEAFLRLFRSRASRREVLAVGGCVAATQLLAIVGIKISSNPVLFSVWQPTQPIVVVAISLVLGWEVPIMRRILGVLAAFAGCCLVALNGADTSSGGLLANVLFCGASLAGAAYQLTSKPLLRKHESLVVTASCYSVAAFLTVLISLALSGSETTSKFLCPDCQDGFWRVPSEAWPALAWWVVMSTCVNYALLMWSIKHSSPTLATSTNALQPIFTAFLSLLALRLSPSLRCSSSSQRCLRTPTIFDAAGGATIITGLLLVVTTESSAALPYHPPHPSELLFEGDASGRGSQASEGLLSEEEAATGVV